MHVDLRVAYSFENFHSFFFCPVVEDILFQIGIQILPIWWVL
jgi:hypothetical protein